MIKKEYLPPNLLKAFIAKMSAGVDVRVDPDEVEKVFEAMATNNFVKIRQGGINPSFLVALVEDEDRIKAAYREIADCETYNRYLNPGEARREFKGLEKLSDIFAGTEKYSRCALPAKVENFN